MKKLVIFFDAQSNLIELNFAFESVDSLIKKFIKKIVQKSFNDAFRKFLLKIGYSHGYKLPEAVIYWI